MQEIEKLIGQLPENFPEAAEEIKAKIVPLLVNCDQGIIEHYVVLIKKHTKAASKPAVKKLITESLLAITNAGIDCCGTDQYESIDPEIMEAAAHLSRDPQLFRKKIDLVNKLGVAGERKNIGITLLTIDSRLLSLKNDKPENLGLKNSGHQGSGKSNTMMRSLKIYPETAYYILSNVSSKGLLMMEDKLKYKAVIFSEGKAFETRGKNDPGQAYAVRSLLSEGVFKYQRPTKTPEGWQTEHLRLEGPISVLTTTIKENLEQQLDDRILTVHTDTSPQQTVKVIEQLAADAAGIDNDIDEKILQTWQCFHDSLGPDQVIVPFAQDLVNNLPKNAPVGARRAFTRVLSAIKTFTVLYQAQRETDEHGRLVAEYEDYAMAYQLMETSFAESLKGKTTKTTDERLKLIEAEKVMTSKALSKKTGVSLPSISDWIKSAVRKGLVTWCDENGETIDDINALNKIKYSGKGYVRIVTGKSLPTPYELTGDPRWDKDGDLYALYDLHLDAEGPVKEDIPSIHDRRRVICNDLQKDLGIADFHGFMDEIPKKSMMH